jgi:hypothetical protein
MNKPLYQDDIVLWSAEQARALREAAAAQLNLPIPIDWDNVAEEIESLGRSERSALRRHIGVIIEHLMKLEASAAQDSRRGWIDSVLRERGEIEALLDDSPSLRREVAGMLAWSMPRARRDVAGSLADHGGQPATDLDQLSYTEEQVLGDWFPAAAADRGQS